MKDTLLTNKQKEILRLRKFGLTIQSIANQLGTSKENIWSIERAALRNIKMAEGTLHFVSSLDADTVCVIPAGTEVKNIPRIVYTALPPMGKNISWDATEFIQQLSSAVSGKILKQRTRADIEVYLSYSGEWYFL